MNFMVLSHQLRQRGIWGAIFVFFTLLCVQKPESAVFYIVLCAMMSGHEIGQLHHLASFWRFSVLGYLVIAFFMLLYIVAWGMYSAQNTFLYLLCAAWAHDTSAYIVGNIVGGAKLCPQISPGKTWSGLWGGFFGTLPAAYFLTSNLLKIVSLSVVLTASFHGGDLLMSYIKRRSQVKDFSNLIPGHGGVLDRIDSVLGAAFAFGLWCYLL